MRITEISFSKRKRTKRAKTWLIKKKYPISHSAVCTKWIKYSSKTKLCCIITLWSNKIELVQIFKRTFWSNDFYDPPSLQPLAWETGHEAKFSLSNEGAPSQEAVQLDPIPREFWGDRKRTKRKAQQCHSSETAIKCSECKSFSLWLDRKRRENANQSWANIDGQPSIPMRCCRNFLFSNEDIDEVHIECLLHNSTEANNDKKRSAHQPIFRRNG